MPTFEQALEEVLAIHRGSWRDGGKSEGQWRASLRDYAIPQLGRRPVDAITTAGRDGCVDADLEREACDRAAGAPADRRDHALGDRAGLPGRQPGW